MGTPSNSRLGRSVFFSLERLVVVNIVLHNSLLHAVLRCGHDARLAFVQPRPRAGPVRPIANRLVPRERIGAHFELPAPPASSYERKTICKIMKH